MGKDAWKKAQFILKYTQRGIQLLLTDKGTSIHLPLLACEGHAVVSCKSCSVVSDSLRPHELYSLWNSPGQNTGVGSLSLL